MRFRQLMLDDEVVVAVQNAAKTYPQAEPSGHECLKADKPWELGDGAGCVGVPNVLRDPKTGLYRMCYRTIHQLYTTPLLYAESADGLVWTKPELGRHAFQNDAARNNILMWTSDALRHGVHMPSVVFDPGRAEEGFRLFNSHKYLTALLGGGREFRQIEQLKLDFPNRAEAIKSQGVFNSDCSRFGYDPVAKVYRLHAKTWSPLAGSAVPKKWRRSVAPAVSVNGRDWTFSGRVLQADLLDDAFVAALPHRRMRDLSAWAELHDMTVHRVEGLLVGLANMLLFYDEGVADGSRAEISGNHSGLDLVAFLWWSKDGVNWSRAAQRIPFLRADTAPGSAHRGLLLFAPTPPIEAGNELRLYYGVPEEAVNTDGKPLRPQWISFARLRRDGWAGYKAAGDDGIVETERLVASGVLNVNADCAGGSLCVGVVEEAAPPKPGQARVFKAVPGFTRDECVPVRGNVIDQEVRWRQRRWTELHGKTVRLRFHLDGSEIYSFWTTAGESGAAPAPDKQ